jgi:hypothetical protein
MAVQAITGPIESIVVQGTSGPRSGASRSPGWFAIMSLRQRAGGDHWFDIRESTFAPVQFHSSDRALMTGLSIGRSQMQ